MAEPIKRAAKKAVKSAVAKKAPAKTIPVTPSPLVPRERKTPAFLNTPFRVAFAAVSSLAVILAFAAGDYRYDPANDGKWRV
jgi:hypothetical protein